MGEPVGRGGGRSVIRLHRERGFYRDLIRAYQVRIDGETVGEITRGETRDFIVPAGEHRVRLTLDRFWGSREATFSVAEGEPAVFTCRPGGPAILILFALLVPHRYIRLTGPIVTAADGTR